MAPRGGGGKYILTGFDKDHDFAQLKEAFKENLDGVTELRRLQRINPDGTQYVTNLIVLCTDHTVPLKPIKKIKTIDYVKFRVRKFNVKAGPT